MARSLGIGRGAGLNNDWVKFDGKAGRVFIPGPEGGPKNVEVRNLCALFDFANIRTGWVTFIKGGPPTFIADASLGQPGPRPEGKFKRGFRINLFSNNQLGGVREMMGNSGVLTDAIVKLFEKYDDAPEAAQGLLPAVLLRDIIPIEGKTEDGTAITNYEPVFEIVSWHARPAELDAALERQKTSAPAAAQAAPAPAAAPAVAPASEFGGTPTANSAPAAQVIAPQSEFGGAGNVSILPPRRPAVLAGSMAEEFGPQGAA